MEGQSVLFGDALGKSKKERMLHLNLERQAIHTVYEVVKKSRRKKDGAVEGLTCGTGSLIQNETAGHVVMNPQAQH